MSLEDIQSSSEADGLELHDTDNMANNENAFSKKDDLNDSIIKADLENKNDLDYELHKNVLEKLDIIKKEQINDGNEKYKSDKLKQENILKEIQKLDNQKIKSPIENNISQDFAKIQQLVNAGLINSKHGQNLKQQVLKKAFDELVQIEKVKRNLQPPMNFNKPALDKNKVFDEFSRSNPEFFNTDGRKDVLEYLKSGEVILGKDELDKISNIIRLVEKTAIDRYLKKVDHEKALRNSNEAAKQRLTANAQKSGVSGGFSRPFTREQIGKMSSAEFTKYEPLIMEQLKKGFIR